MRSPLLGVAACWASGILLASALHAGIETSAWMLAAAAAALLGSLFSLHVGRATPAIALAAAGFILAGAVSATLFPFRFAPDNIRNLEAWGFEANHSISTRLVVNSVPVRTPTGFEFNANVLQVRGRSRPMQVSGKILLRLRVPSKAASWNAIAALNLEAGDIIQAPVRFYHATGYRNPGNFNYNQWLNSIEDISWEGTIENPVDVRKLKGRGISWESAAIAKVRSRLLAGIDRLYPAWSKEGRDGAVLKAILLGDRSALDSNTIESFRNSGLYHLLVISGLHVGLLAALALAFFRWLGLRDVWRGGALLLLLAGYALLVEQRAPTLRATLMIALYILALYLYRDRVGLNAVGFAALILLALRPPWLFEAGFQLSFSAALLIFAVVVPILDRTTLPYARTLKSIEDEKRDASLEPRKAQFRLDLRSLINFLEQKSPLLARHPKLARGIVILPLKALLWTVELTVFSAILQIGLMMPMAESFHRITFAGIGLNTLAFPLMAVLLGLAVPTVILAAIYTPLAVIPAKLLAGVISMLFWLTTSPRLPLWLSYRIPAPPAWVAWGFALSVVAVAWALAAGKQRSLGLAACAFTVFAVLLAWYPFSPRIPGGELQATALDCGRGESTFLVLPDRTTVLVGACGQERMWWDAAAYRGRWDPGEDIVSPYLWSRGIKRIDILVALDSKPGMLDGMAAIIRNFRPRQLWRLSAGAGPEMDRLESLIQTVNGFPREINSGSSIRQNGSVFNFLTAPVESVKDESRQPAGPIGLRISARAGSLIMLNASESRSQSVFLPRQSVRSEVMEIEGRSTTIFEDKALLKRILPEIVIASGGSRQSQDPLALPSNALARKTTFLSTEINGAVTVNMKNSRLAYYADEGSAGTARNGSAWKAF